MILANSFIQQLESSKDKNLSVTKTPGIIFDHDRNSSMILLSARSCETILYFQGGSHFDWGKAAYL